MKGINDSTQYLRLYYSSAINHKELNKASLKNYYISLETDPCPRKHPELEPTLSSARKVDRDLVSINRLATIP